MILPTESIGWKKSLFTSPRWQKNENMWNSLGVSWWMESLRKSQGQKPLGLGTSQGTPFTMIPPRLFHTLSQSTDCWCNSKLSVTVLLDLGGWYRRMDTCKGGRAKLNHDQSFAYTDKVWKAFYKLAELFFCLEYNFSMPLPESLNSQKMFMWQKCRSCKASISLLQS